jgi:Flp pilus assembly protein CpaB
LFVHCGSSLRRKRRYKKQPAREEEEMKKYIPIILAVAVFLVALVLLQPEEKIRVAVLTADLPAGHMLTAADVEPREVPLSYAPADAVTTSAGAVGQVLKSDRSAGDVLREAHLGEPMSLQVDERAVAIMVDDASGLGGLIGPGDMVGVTAVVFGDNAAFSKATVEGIRVLYVSPEFRAGFLDARLSSADGGSMTVAGERSQEGTVVLAVPVEMMDVKYDFSATGGTVETRKVNVVELLSALAAAGNAKIVLYLMPENPAAMDSAGLYLPDLILRPTPTEQPAPTAAPAE